MDDTRCQVRRCKAEYALTHKGTRMCQKHWEAHCAEEADQPSSEWQAVYPGADYRGAEPTEDETGPPDTPVEEPATDAVAPVDTQETEDTMAAAKTKRSSKTARKGKTTTPRTKKAKAPAAEKKMSALDAAAKVLEDAGEAMGCKVLITKMEEKNLWKSPGGKTPWATLYSAMMREINTSETPRFVKVDRGQFEFNPKAA